MSRATTTNGGQVARPGHPDSSDIVDRVRGEFARRAASDAQRQAEADRLREGLLTAFETAGLRAERERLAGLASEAHSQPRSRQSPASTVTKLDGVTGG